MTKNNAVITFIKSPEKGRVKTRLAKGVGEKAALALYQYFVMDVLDMVRSTPWALRVYYHPEKSGRRIRSWLGNDLDLFPQAGTTLGDKMQNALAETFAAGYERAVLIGSDLPDLPPDIIDTAFNALNSSDAVIGPSPDGGFYLIGFTAKGFIPEIFNHIPWGTHHVFDLTQNNFSGHGVSPVCLPVWRDIDTKADLQLLGIDPASGPAMHTIRYLQKKGLIF
ncbi:TIGR04282 family arsenosugar biosynthesis glycosyltransferase [Desulfobacter latus]|uniref:TIGR04282 family arsenosugar biosynthesis glycosyltransferase n=1 Tax=Desulfobacter latus TaxID=2292 RepID=A0A850SWW5_9BACT|nr:TIGR04282 family arsenosugar biosynthesis glycosyltransferase [Desulfobacter latus]NWH03903.1 TIGR04282 family arsenosugar biosynthesis glycosyltransferase [Desulfobacter latus]